MSPGNDERRPCRGGVQTPGEVVTPIVTRAALADRVDGALVVLVSDPSGRYRRRTFLTLASAERAVKAARDRGAAVHVVLARLVAVEDVTAAVEDGAA